MSGRGMWQQQQKKLDVNGLQEKFYWSFLIKFAPSYLSYINKNKLIQINKLLKLNNNILYIIFILYINSIIFNNELFKS